MEVPAPVFSGLCELAEPILRESSFASVPGGGVDRIHPVEICVARPLMGVLLLRRRRQADSCAPGIPEQVFDPGLLKMVAERFHSA